MGNAGNDAFMFQRGEADGDIIVDFAGNGASAGDVLLFVGYGPGATFTQNDATQWQVNYDGGSSHEVIVFLNGAPVDTNDVAFLVSVQNFSSFSKFDQAPASVCMTRGS